MRRAIITGATGAIGTALIQDLVSNGVQVLVLSRKDSKRKDRIPDHPLVTKMDCALDQLGTLQNDTNETYDVFYHLAWQGTFGPARNDMDTQIQNIRFSIDAVHLAKRFGCSVFVGVGSQAEYGRSDGKLTPSTPTFPENGYGIAKLCAGQMTRIEASSLGIRHNWVRVLSVYGPNDGENTLVMSLVNKLKQGIVPECTKGEQIWDYLYSGDAATALRLVGQRGKENAVYVLGGGRARPLAEYITLIRDIVNPSCAVKLGAFPYPEKQVMYLWADISDLERDTGWKPKMDFAAGVRELLHTV